MEMLLWLLIVVAVGGCVVGYQGLRLVTRNQVILNRTIQYVAARAAGVKEQELTRTVVQVLKEIDEEGPEKTPSPRFWVGFLVVVALVFGLDRCLSQHTVYLALRTPTGRLLPTSRVVYKVFPSTQTVISWVVETPNLPPSRLASCAVRDARNWHCSFSDGSGSEVMTDGDLSTFDENGAPQQSDLTYLSRYRWYVCRYTGRWC
jgi:hypothetical protein